ncbi:MAG TPA: MarR family transcriptional regulator [Jatrophihabitantaceae bacterium]|jgi:DNA-binding MarR family transcriptional regulator|nr:MarR family transcriptional regulator [Jatrophihabitantaceae bacterium]
MAVGDGGQDAGQDGDGQSGFVGNWASVVRAVDGVQHKFGLRLEALGISLPYFSVLTLLLEAPDRRLPMSRIARDLSMTSGGFTKLADRMARDGLIDRRGSSGDRRVVFAALTDVGLELARRADAAYRAFLRDDVLGVVSLNDLETLAAIAGRLGEVSLAEPEPQPFELTDREPDAPDRRTRDQDDGEDS